MVPVGNGGRPPRKPTVTNRPQCRVNHLPWPSRKNRCGFRLRHAYTVASLTSCAFAASATDARSAARNTATICSSVNRLFLGSSPIGSHLPKNDCLGELGQISLPRDHG